MMERILARGREAATAYAAALAERLAEAAAGEVPHDVIVEVADEGIVLSGRALRVRSLRDSRLRGFAALARAR